eukprot:CAMPEP_0168478292 /NCGR_PEP_ID=MMETSP0228-20121227/62870_1 /TAXON_ID=133427 /ORGANISM="Protoceratium reticulatum, Strain CCCM 535 (=CCMP 1889)" /LENGTH=41 /DNA_ID= /DNA_START= /DNA_END= /DNA_ORIENTATION=
MAAELVKAMGAVSLDEADASSDASSCDRTLVMPCKVPGLEP